MPGTVDLFMKYRNPVFIETGTWVGDGVLRALGAGFEEVHSVELNEPQATQAMTRWKGNPRVHIVKGDSPAFLSTVLRQINRPATLWLDAHMDTCDDPCPIMKELNEINNFFQCVETVLIDDMRLMRPRQSKIIEMLQAVQAKFWIGFEEDDSGVQKDILVATRRGPR